MTGVEEPKGEREPRRDAGLDPIGNALRQTYHAENHDSLGNDLTGLMLQLARVEDVSAPPPVVTAMPLASPARALRWWERLFAPNRPR